jgi:Family of unknown function (DUF6084)
MPAPIPRPDVERVAMPQLAFAVEEGAPLDYAAVPTLRFGLRVESVRGEPIRSILLDVQVQIAARRRPYDDIAQARLVDLFGTPDRWGTTLRTLPWARTTLVVPPFEGSAAVDLHIVCSYDLEVTASRYLYALENGEVPLEFLFSGAIFYTNADGQLQTTRIGWDQEAEYALPVQVWKETMDRHFPNSAWLRLGKESFDRLQAYKTEHGFVSWDDAVGALLPEDEES